MSARAQRYGRQALTDERRGMLGKIHIARQQLGLDEAAYRDVVERITGGCSARVASDAALHRLLAEFTRLGFKPARKGWAPARSKDAQVRMIQAIWAELAPFVGDASPDALRAFVRRQTRTARHPGGVDAPEFLDAKEANKVLEGLKAWLARARAKAAEP
jgi:phage gp16-like protein